MEFIDERKNKAEIKVVGVGGCGGNVVKAMAEGPLQSDVAFYAVNTDAQDLGQISNNCTCVQIGDTIAQGLGVGADPEKGKEAAKADTARLREIVTGADMVFITAGMGGGTGTGAAPEVAKICQELAILTVAVVTMPEVFENRTDAANEGVSTLSNHVDTIIILENERATNELDDDEPLALARANVNNILISAVSGICEVIYRPGEINLDFADLRQVMTKKGKAVMATATEKGPDRVARAFDQISNNPMFEGVKLDQAQSLLVLVSVGTQDSLLKREHFEIREFIGKLSAENTPQIFYGQAIDEKLMGDMMITLIATGCGGPVLPSSARGGRRPAKTPPFMRNAGGPGKRRSPFHQARLLDENAGTPSVLKNQVS